MDLTVRLEGLERARHKIGEAFYEVKQGTDRAVRLAIARGAEVARATHRYKNRTGNLEKYTDAFMLSDDPDAPLGQFYAAMEYSSFVNLGNGSWAPDPFMEEGAVEAEKTLQIETQRVVDAACQKASDR